MAENITDVYVRDTITNRWFYRGPNGLWSTLPANVHRHQGRFLDRTNNRWYEYIDDAHAYGGW